MYIIPDIYADHLRVYSCTPFHSPGAHFDIVHASIHEDNSGYFSWGVNFCYFVFDLVSQKFPPTKMSAFTVMLELACMEAIKARGMVRTIMNIVGSLPLSC